MQALKYCFLFSFLLMIGCQSPPAENQPDLGPHEESGMTLEQKELAEVKEGRVTFMMMGGEIECAGIVEAPPQYQASVYTPVPGFIKDLKYLPGSHVQKGAHLASLEHPEIFRLQREFLETQSQLAYLRSDLARKDTLASANAASQRDLEKAQADLQLQEARYEGLKAELSLMGIQVEKLEMEGQIQKRLPLYAPVSGHITEVNGHIGMLVNSETPIYKLVDASHSHVELEVYAKDIAKLKEGQTVLCQVPGEETLYRAEVHLLGKMIDPETRTLRIHGHFETEPTPLLPGTFLQATIQLEGQEVPTVPATAIVQSGGEEFLFLVDGDHYKKIPVQTGLHQNGTVELVDWKYPEDQQVVTNGAYYLNGMEGEGPEHSH